MADETLTVFTADHGDHMGAHGLMAKATAYDEVVRVPLILHWPARIPAAPAIELSAANVDVWPTLAGLLGLPPPPPVEGIDMSPLVPLMSAVSGTSLAASDPAATETAAASARAAAAAAAAAWRPADARLIDEGSYKAYVALWTGKYTLFLESPKRAAYAAQLAPAARARRAAGVQTCVPRGGPTDILPCKTGNGVNGIEM